MSEANARLIASAPELLAFADNAVPLLYLFKALLDETWITAGPALKKEIESKLSAVKQVALAGDRAITKATGEAL